MKRVSLLLMLCVAMWMVNLGCPGPAPTEPGPEPSTEVVPDANTPDENKPDENKPDENKPDEKPDTPVVPDPRPEPPPVDEPGQPDAGPEMKPEMMPEMKPEATPELTPETKPETNPNAKPDPNAATQITSVRGGTAGDIKGAAVTYLKPKVGQDQEGFFLQATAAGPAIFVEADLATAKVAVGDIISLKADTIDQNVQGRAHVTKYSNLTIDAKGYDVTMLATDVSSASDLVSKLGDYESRLLKFEATIASDFSFAGAGYLSAQIETTGIKGETNLKFRLPDKDGTTPSLAETLGLVKGCVIEVSNIPMWRFNAQAQPLAENQMGIKVKSCPMITVTKAQATAEDKVVITFSGAIDSASLTASGAQFSFDNGLTASAATATGPNTVEVTTAKQDGTKTYKVTVDTSLKDKLGQGVDSTANTASFTGFSDLAQVRVNEVNANISNSCDLIELRVIKGGSMDGFVVKERGSTIYTFAAGFKVKINDLIVVHLDKKDCNPDNAADETTAPNAQAAATYSTNYDTAYDVYSTDTGLTSTNNVIAVEDSTGKIQDAMIFLSSATASIANATETEAQRVGTANEWVDTAGMSVSFTKANLPTHAVVGAPASSKTGDSFQRKDDNDTNNKNDWGTVTSTWGALNVGQKALTGGTTGPTAKLVINEFNASLDGGCDLVEIRVEVGGKLDDFTLYDRGTKVADFTGLTLKKNDYIVVHFDANDTKCKAASTQNETTSPNQVPASTEPKNFDTAYDIYTTSGGLPASTGVLSIRDTTGAKIYDTVAYTDAGSTASSASLTAADDAVKASQWGPTTAAYTAATYKTDAVADVDNGAATPAGKSIQRKSNTDTNTKADWNDTETSTWGKNNKGQTDF